MKIYTKTGDKGKTSLLSGKRVNKSDLRLEAYGTVDELNSFLSQIVYFPINTELNTLLKEYLIPLAKTQHYLFNLGSHLACDDKSILASLPPLETSLVSDFEILMDKINEETPELKNFILPGGCQLANHAHFARSICRRAERRCTQLEPNEALEQFVIPFLNRLSDYLFCFSRYANKVYEKNDILWDKSQL